jgi:hypothetical protein
MFAFLPLLLDADRKAKETARRGDILELAPSLIKVHWDDAVQT